MMLFSSRSDNVELLLDPDKVDINRTVTRSVSACKIRTGRTGTLVVNWNRS
jgi:hypothetical protein